MIKINNINFCEKSIENIEVCGILKEIKCEFHGNIFKITIMNNDGEEVIEVFEEEKVEHEVEEPVVEEPVVEEPVNKKLTIADVKNIIYESIPKKILGRRISELSSRYMKILRKMTFINSCKKKMKLLNLLKPNTTN